MITTIDAAYGRRARGLAGLILALVASGCTSANRPQPVEPASKPPAPETGPAAAKTARKPSFATSPDGTRIAYETRGAGPALMLLHGGGQTRTAWHDGGYVDRLSKQFTVITIDQRGVGDSDKPATAAAYQLDRMLADLVAVADSAGAKRFHLWGYGQGASIGRYLAARSDRVISAVVVGANMGPTLTGIVKDAIVAMRAKWLPLLQAKQAGTLDPASLSPGDRTTLEGGTPLAALALGALVDYPALEPAEIKVPTLWLVGGDRYDSDGKRESVRGQAGRHERDVEGARQRQLLGLFPEDRRRAACRGAISGERGRDAVGHGGKRRRGLLVNGPQGGRSCRAVLLHAEAVLDRRVVPRRRTRDDLELEHTAGGSDTRRNLKLRDRRRKVDTHLCRTLLHEELVAGDLDRASLSDLGMRFGDLIPINHDWRSNLGEHGRIAIFSRGQAGYRGLGRRCEDVREPDPAFKGAAFLRSSFDLIHALRKSSEECCGIQLIKRRLGAFERQLRQPLGAKAAFADDGEQLTIIGTLDFEARPRAAVDRGMNSKIAIRVVELEEQFGNLKRPARLPTSNRHAESSRRDQDHE